jgi:hypothetical protein
MPLDRIQVEGTPEEVIAKLRELPAEARYFVQITRRVEQPVMTQELRAAMERLSRPRTPEEIEEIRRRTTVYTPPPLVLPPGKTIEDVVRELGPGPDDPVESEEEIRRALEEMS